MSIDQHIQYYFEVSDDSSVNEVIKGIYSSSGLDLSQFSTMQFRKALNAGTCFVNQVIFGGQLAYSKEYADENEALADLPTPLITDKNNLICCMLIDWDALPTGNKTLPISGCNWHDISDPMVNIEMALQLFKMKKLKTFSNPMDGWPSIPDTRIRFHNTHIADKQILNFEENRILDTVSAVSQFIPGKENVVLQDSPIGAFNIFETTNTDYGDINVIRKKAINPYYEEITHRNSSFMDQPDGTRTQFYLPDFLCSETGISVYKNGLRLKLGTDYQAYVEHDLIIFATPPAQTDVLVCDFDTKLEHFYVNTSFNGVCLVEAEQSANDIRVLNIDGVDREYRTDNNFSMERHGFHPMRFCSEGTGQSIQITNAPSPAFAGQKALHFSHGSSTPDTEECSRTECQITGQIGTNRLVSEVEVFIPSDVGNTLNSSDIGPIDWLTLQEYWEGRSENLVGGPYNDQTERRLILGMLKTSTYNYLHFELWSQDVVMNPLHLLDYDKELVSNVHIPIGEWFKLHVEIMPGDQEHGKFLMTMTQSDSTTTVIFADAPGNRLRTICPRQSKIMGNYDLRLTKRPVYEEYCTMKLYTSATLQNEMNRCGTPLNIYFRNHHLDCVRAIRT